MILYSKKYLLDDDIIEDLKAGKNGDHASILAAIIIYNFSKEVDVPAYIFDLGTVDEFKLLSDLLATKNA